MCLAARRPGGRAEKKFAQKFEYWWEEREAGYTGNLLRCFAPERCFDAAARGSRRVSIHVTISRFTSMFAKSMADFISKVSSSSGGIRNTATITPMAQMVVLS